MQRNMLPSLKFRENPMGEDQRPLARYLRHLHKTNPTLETQTVLRCTQKSDASSLDMETAYCNPFFWMCEMKTDKTFGCHLVADQDIEKGASIGYEHPIVYVTKSRYRCSECDRPLPAKGGIRCTKHNEHPECCNLVFCSDTCRDWAWDHYHKVQDHTVMLTLPTTQTIDLLFVLKVLSMMELPVSNKHALTYIKAFLQNPHVTECAKHMELASPGLHRFKAASGFSNAMDCGIDNSSVQELVSKLFALRHIYAFGTGDSSFLFGPSCCINHSCEPNVSVGCLTGHDWSDITKPFGVIEAIRPIKRGEQLFFDYRKNSMSPRSNRKANLKAQYGFDCHCSLCNASTPRCDYEGCRAEILKPKRCSNCKTAIYCNRACQAKDWAHHKKFCKLKAAGRTF